MESMIDKLEDLGYKLLPLSTSLVYLSFSLLLFLVSFGGIILVVRKLFF